MTRSAKQPLGGTWRQWEDGTWTYYLSRISDKRTSTGYRFLDHKALAPYVRSASFIASEIRTDPERRNALVGINAYLGLGDGQSVSLSEMREELAKAVEGYEVEVDIDNVKIEISFSGGGCYSCCYDSPEISSSIEIKVPIKPEHRKLMGLDD